MKNPNTMTNSDPIGAKIFSAVLRQRAWLLQLLLVALLLCTEQTFGEDLLRPGALWYGHAMPKMEPSGMALAGHGSEATLAGTTMNPENLTNFTLKLRWNFGGNSNGSFRVGWGKPFEWGTFDQCTGWVTVQADGRARVYSEGRELGQLQLPISARGAVSLTVSRRSSDIVLASEGKDTSFPIPADLSAGGGYLTLRSEGYERNGKILRVESAELAAAGNRPPLSVAQQEEGIRRWEKSQVDGVWNTLTNFEEYFKANNAGRWAYKTDLHIEPGLVRPGEKVRLYFRCAEPVPSECTASVQANYLSGSPGAIEPLVLPWRKTKDGALEAEVALKPEQVGNWHVVWRVGAEQLSRVFGVVDDDCAVVRLLTTSDRNLNKTNPPPAGFDAIHEAGLAGNFWNAGNGISRTPEQQLARYRRLMAFHHLWGDEIIPLMHADTIIPGAPDKNLFKVSDDVQREGIQQTMKLWDLLGIGPMNDLGGYTFSDSTPEIARSLGIKSIDCLCQWQNWADLGGDNNGWQINDLGAPTVPYFVAKDDFRKVAPGRSIVALPEQSTSDVRIYCIYAGEGQPQQNFMRQQSYNGAMVGESWNIDRFEAAMDLLLAESRYQNGPRFLFVGLENFIDSPDWNQANRLAVKHFVEAARHQKVVFAQASAIADYYQRHYQQQPENWFYWPDVYAGLAYNYKPAQLPDRIELMNAKFYVVYEDGSTLPQFFWDYTRLWSAPEWEEQPAIRQKYGLVDPALITASNCVPPIVDLAGVSATVTMEPQAEGAEARVMIESPRPLPMLPVALWHIPLDPQTLGTVKASAHARYVRVVDGSTGNLHGVLVCSKVPAGRSVWTVKFEGELRTPLMAEIHIGTQVSGRFFPRANGPSAYVWLTDAHVGSGVLTIQVPDGRAVTLHYNDGQTEQTVGGTLLVKLNRTWQHQSPMIIGLTAAEIQAEAQFQPTKKP
jgi:hypothetical protein